MAITLKQNTQIQLEKQGKKKKNTKYNKTTTHGLEPTNPIKKYKPESTNISNQEAKREKY
jgi:hypothetical protein